MPAIGPWSEPFGWIGRKAEWVVPACLHGDGVFTREQLAFHLQMSPRQVVLETSPFRIIFYSTTL